MAWTAAEVRQNMQAGLDLLPLHMHGGVIRYVEYGVEPGGFILCLLQGKLDDAKARADHVNLSAWERWQVFLSDHLPLEAHNTPDKVVAWRAHRGLEGLA